MAVLYGEFVDLSLMLLTGVDAASYPTQAVLCLLSVLVTGFGVFLTVKANVIILASEGIASAIAQVTRQEFGRMKIAVDCSLLALGVALSLALFRGLAGIREGTVVAAVAVGLVVQLCGRRLGWLDRLWASRAGAATTGAEAPAPAKPHLVITIAREFGPNGVKIAHALARELGLKLYDEELVDLAIRESGLDPNFVRKNEERLSRGLLYDLYAQSFEYAPGQRTADDALFQAQQRVIRRLAAEEDCVILGRSANFMLGKGPGLFHVYLHADPKWRLAETMEEFGLKEGQARALLTRTDSERARRYRHNTGRAWGLASDYDLCLDVSGYGVERSAQLLRDAVRSFVYAPGESRGCPAGENVIQSTK